VYYWKICVKVISLILIMFIVTGDMGIFAQDMLSKGRMSPSEIAASSRFWKMPVIVRQEDGEFVIESDLTDVPLVNTDTSAFRDDVVFLYLSRLIAQVMTKYKESISAENLITLIERHLSGIGFFHDSKFKWREMYKDENTFCLPYVREHGPMKEVLLLRYFLPEENKDGLFGRIAIPVDLEDVMVTCELGEGMLGGDALMVYVNLLKESGSLSRMLSEEDGTFESFYGSLLRVLFSRLRQDFDNTDGFIALCGKIHSEEGIHVLREKIAKGSPEIKKAFMAVKSGEKTQDRSISPYGVMFFFLTSTPGHLNEMQKTVLELFDESVKRGFFPEDPEYTTEAERGEEHKGEEVFEARGRKFSFPDLLRWKVPDIIVNAIVEHVPEIQENARTAQAIYSMEENALVIGERYYSLYALEEKGVPPGVLQRLESKREEMEGLLKDFTGKREKLREGISWALKHLFTEFMKTRGADQLALTKQGVSYHVAGHSIVHLYPKGLIYEGQKALFMRSIMTNYGETIPKRRTWTENADKVSKALALWGSLLPGTENIRQRFMEKASVVELGLDTAMLFSFPDKNVVRPLQIGRGRHVFYFSKKYLDDLDLANDSHMRELAFMLSLGQSFLDKHTTLESSGNDLETIQKKVDDFNLHFLEEAPSGLIKPGEIRKRLYRAMKSDFVVANTNAIEEILKEEQEISLVQARLERSGMDFRTRRSELHKLFWLNYSLLSRYHGLEMHEMADKTYRRLREVTKDMQHHDRAGLMPYSFQIRLVFTALKFGYWDDFIQESETLLTGGDLLNDLSAEEKAFIRQIRAPKGFEGEYGLEEELMRSLHVQIRVMSPENADEIEKKIKALIALSNEPEREARRESASGEDDFDRLVLNCKVLDLDERPRGYTRREAFDMIAEAGASSAGISSREFLRKLEERETEGSTVVMPGIAIPHIILDHDKDPGIVLLRSKSGVMFPGKEQPVKAIFALMGPREEKAHVDMHLKTLSAIAQIAGVPDFMDKWLDCGGAEDVRELVLRADRVRARPEAEQNKKIESEVKSGDSGDEPGDVKPGLSLERERLIARDFVEALIGALEMGGRLRGEKDNKIVIGIDTGWIPRDPANRARLQELLNSLRDIPRKRGFERVVIRMENSAEGLAEDLAKVKKDTNTDNSNLIILSSAGAVGGKVFNGFKSRGKEPGAFLAGVEIPEDFPPDSYTRIIEMLAMSVKMAYGLAIKDAHPEVIFKKVNDRVYVLFPSAVPFDHGVYSIQKKEIDGSA
jgi:mannitol/fructose-specific phosphotransferase system IIA component (Ntr-type)